jgi:glycoprotein endo-alpha-1,2-mannosidase
MRRGKGTSQEAAPALLAPPVRGRIVSSLALAALVLVVAGPAAAARGVSIFYYPWYGTPSRDGGWEHWAENGHRPPADIASAYYPARGPYSSSDGQVLTQQMRELAEAGIEEVVSSWWGWGSPEDLRLPAILRAARRQGLTVAVQIEPYEKWQRTAPVVAADLLHLRDLGVRRVYVFRPFGGPIDDAAWAELTRLAGDMEILAQTGNVARAAAAGFDGVYTYDLLRYGPRTFAGLCRRAHALGLLCAPSVGPGYEALRATGDPRRLPRRDGATYDAMWLAAIGAGADRVTITSYNEWHEGTQIEPARAPAQRASAVSPVLPAYASYEGAYGLRGRAAERAYLLRTRLWASAYAAARRALQLLGLLSP